MRKANCENFNLVSKIFSKIRDFQPILMLLLLLLLLLLLTYTTTTTTIDCYDVFIAVAWSTVTPRSSSGCLTSRSGWQTSAALSCVKKLRNIFSTSSPKPSRPVCASSARNASRPSHRFQSSLIYFNKKPSCRYCSRPYWLLVTFMVIQGR